MSDEAGGGELQRSGRAGRGRPRNALPARMDPDRRAFADLIRAQFFDRMKAMGWDYARISQRLGRGFSAATLSRIANGEKVPDRHKLNAILGLVEEIAKQPLTAHVRQHVYEVYMRALAVAKPEWHHAYLVEDENRRLQGEVEKQSRLGQADSWAGSSSSGSELDPEHPVVQLRDEVRQHVQRAVQAQIPLITQPLLRPEPSAALSPADAMLFDIRQGLGLVRESVIRHVTLLEAAEDLSAPETTPIGAVPAAEPVAHPSAPAQPPQNTARRALYAAATVILVIGVLLLGVVLKDALRPNGTTAAPSNKPAQTVDTGTTTGGDTSTSARPPSTSAQDGNIGPSAPEGEADRTNDGGTSDGATNQNSDGGPSKGGTNQLNGGGVSESVTASATPSTQSRSPGEWTLTIRLAPDSDGDIQVAHNGGEQETCSKSLNGPAVECDYSIPDNNTVTLIPVDFVESWGSGLCEGADRRGGCSFFGNTSDTEFNLFVMRDPG